MVTTIASFMNEYIKSYNRAMLMFLIVLVMGVCTFCWAV